MPSKEILTAGRDLPSYLNLSITEKRRHLRYTLAGLGGGVDGMIGYAKQQDKHIT